MTISGTGSPSLNYPDAPMLFEPGHYYSPIANVREVRQRHDQIFRSPESLPGIELRAEQQLELAGTLGNLVSGHPFEDQPVGGLRYGFENDFFSYGDGLVLHGMVKHLRPGRYVEIGSGWSSALVLDTLDREPDLTTRCTFIEPYPDRLRSLLRAGDIEQEIIVQPLSGVDPAVFAALEAGDVLFVDSTHVSKAGSDVNQLFFEVLPVLSAGIHIHIHDIFYPFEYVSEWVYQGRNWNESYLLRAYLINNPKIRINWFNSYLAQHHRSAVSALIPLWERNPGGSIWLETLA